MEPVHRTIEPFNKRKHSREQFCCEVQSLETYFRTQANQDLQRKVAAVFVLAEGSSVVGYYTLSSYSIETGELTKEAQRRLPNYPKLPAVLIGRLARDSKWRGQGIGQLLLVDALKRCLENTSTVGAAAVVVEAENETALEFYREHGFPQFPDHPQKLFMMMSMVRETFKSA